MLTKNFPNEVTLIETEEIQLHLLSYGILVYIQYKIECLKMFH